jgi:threonine dehydratase
MVTLADIQAARQRIVPYVRRTPMIKASALQDTPYNVAELMLKLECLQVTGSFKARGASNKLASLTPEQLQRGIVTASGGNHGLAKVPTRVFLPVTTPPAKVEKVARWGAEVIKVGQVFDDANVAALEYEQQYGATYFHPFDDATVIAGQGTTALEILDDYPEVDTMLIAIGGGGLISGMSLAVKALKPNVKIIGIEPVGAPTLKRSLEADKVIELEEIRTTVNTLAPRRSAQINLDIIRDHVDDIVLVTDEEMLMAAQWLYFEMGIAAELSGSAAMAALLTGKITTSPSDRVCALICGAGRDGIPA